MSQVILITGASSGIGLQLCKQYHDSGKRVIATCRKSTPVLKDVGVKIIENIDITSSDDCHRLHEALRNETLDILINNAGVLFNETLEDMNFQNIQRQIDVNAIAPLRVTHSLLDCMHPGSKVVMITSRMGSIDDNDSGAYYGYRMSKAALNMAGTSLAKDLSKENIAVGLLHPGLVRTKMTGFNGSSTQDAAKNLIERISEISMENSGSFRHADGQTLPW